METVYAYRSIVEQSEGQYHESGSKFLAYVIPVADHGTVEQAMGEIKSMHPTARHHCYAYRILERNETTEYCSDAGEPSGSAGQPILGELRRNGLLNVIAIVVRYFGGTKLGIPGLIHAYRESTAQALQHTKQVEVTRVSTWKVSMPLATQPLFYAACKLNNATISVPEYTTKFSAQIDIPLKGDSQTLRNILASIAGRDGQLDELKETLSIIIEPSS